jgi:hypothetical protein
MTLVCLVDTSVANRSWEVETEPAKRRRRTERWMPLALLALAAAYLVFCHGCHGDEDNEPFVLRRVDETVRNPHISRTSALPSARVRARAECPVRT